MWGLLPKSNLIQEIWQAEIQSILATAAEDSGQTSLFFQEAQAIPVKVSIVTNTFSLLHLTQIIDILA